jgi:hypothetical protein
MRVSLVVALTLSLVGCVGGRGLFSLTQGIQSKRNHSKQKEIPLEIHTNLVLIQITRFWTLR